MTTLLDRQQTVAASPPTSTRQAAPHSLEQPAIELAGVYKCYGDLFALQDINLQIAPGSTVALLGPNGAGKTTLLNVIAGLATPSDGVVCIGGRPTTRSGGETAVTVGLLTHKTMLYDRLTGRENLALHAALRGVNPRRIETVLAQVNLLAAADRRVDEYSHGMRKRIGLARALLHEPAVLLLDEPFSGLDPESRHGLCQLLDSMRSARTILFSTHDVERATAHADRLLVLRNGRIVSDQVGEQPIASASHHNGCWTTSPAAADEMSPLNKLFRFGATAAAMLKKDLVMELRGRTATTAMVLLAGLLATVLGMAFESLAGQPPVISGVLWVIITFAAVHGLNRSFEEEFRDDALVGLLFTGADPAALYLGKIVSNSLLLTFVSLIAMMLAGIFFNAPGLMQHFPALLLVIGLAVIGLTAVGGILTVIARHSRLGESFLPILFLPLIVPVLLAGIESTSILLQTGVLDRRWLQVLAFFAAGMVAATAVFFEYTVEE